MIKKINKFVFASLLLSSSAFAQNELSNSQIKDLEKIDILQKSNITVTKAIDAGSLYILNIKAQNAMDTVYLTKDKKYLISGDVLSTSNGMPLDMPVDMNILKGKEAFTFGKGDTEYVLFTDPECPYCRKFESYFPQIEDKVKIKIFYYPLDFHKNAKDLSVYILSQKTTEDKIKAMLTTNANDPSFINRKISDKQKEELEKKIDEHLNLAFELGVKGTPALFDKDGNKVIWVKLLQDLGITVK